MEFKVLDDESEKKLSDTVEAAKRQIEDKAYDTELLELGFSRTQIKHYGFAFSGKKVLIG